MTVYIVFGVHVEGNVVLAIFSKKEKAETYAKAMRKRLKKDYDGTCVHEYIIDKT